MGREQLRAALMQDEGLRLHPYADVAGKWSIGYGRNLTDVGISLGEARGMLENDIDRAEDAVNAMLPWADRLDTVRHEVLVQLAFNLGINGLLGFRRMLAHLQREEWAQAAAALLDSKAAKQTGHRYDRLARELETGQA